jgi:hypothetical protein
LEIFLNTECSKTVHIFAQLNINPCTGFIYAIVPTYEHRYTRKDATNVLHIIKRRKANWTSHVLRKNFHINDVTKKEGGEGGREDEEADVCRYWMGLMKTDDAEIMRKPWFAPWGKLAL